MLVVAVLLAPSAAASVVGAGPAAAADTVAYRQARERFFDGPVEANAQREIVDVDVEMPDMGIVVARAFIDENSETNNFIGDERSWSHAPLASARGHLAWDTGRGQVSLLMQESCAGDLEAPGVVVCAAALPVQLVADASAVGEYEGGPFNFVTVAPGSRAGELRFEMALTNSLTAGLPPPANLGRINAEGTLAPAEVFRDPAGGTRGPGIVTVTADRFPSWEFRRYPADG